MAYKWMHLKREFNHLITDDRSGTVLTRCGQLLARTDFQGEMDEPYCLSCKNRQDRDAIKRAEKLAKKQQNNSDLYDLGA